MTFQALLFCPDEKTARVTTQVLNELEFSVESCAEPFAAVKKLMSQHFDAIVVDCDNEQNASLLFKSARNSSSNQASLSVAVVEGQTGVANAFRLGANLVLTKPINVEQAKSTLRVARGLLRKGSDPKAAAPSAPSAISTQAPRTLSSPEPARSASTVTAVAKPSVPVFQAPKPAAAAAVAKTSVESSGVLDLEDELALEGIQPEEILFDTPVQTAVPKSPAAKDYPWQPPAKSTDAMSTAMRRAAEAVESSPTIAASSAAQANPTVDLSRRAMASSASISYSGAASAPAPAKEAPPKTTIPAQRIAPASVAPSSGSAPSLGAFTSGYEAEAEDDGSKKKIIIGAVAAAVLLVAGYFGFSSMHKPDAPKAVAQTPAPVQAAPVAAAPAEPATQEIELSTSPSPSQPAPQSTASASRSAKPTADKEPEVTITHPDASKQSLVVKSDVGHATAASKEQQISASDIPAPALPGPTSADPSALSNIMKSAPVSVPRVAAPVETLKVSQGVTQGLLLKRVQPSYPAQARQLRVQGSVLLQAMIARSGNISSIKVLEGEPTLARAAVEAVKQWKYKPYYLNGEPVDIQTQITINFKLP